MFIFFFQAEDGIRDAQESRGLGDVYKRQNSASSDNPPELPDDVVGRPFLWLVDDDQAIDGRAVSYTHLTLPTIYSV